MQCREFMQYAERWMDGERDAHASAHVKSCANCSALVADLETISHSAMELREAEPPARVWVSLRNQLESEGVIRETAAVAVAEPSRSAMQCGEFLRYAERWMDGERDALAAAHLKACANCSASRKKNGRRSASRFRWIWTALENNTYFYSVFMF